MRRLFVVTVGRSDFGIYRPVLDRIEAEPTLAYELVVCGAHLADGTRGTVSEIVAEGRPIAARIPQVAQSSDQNGMAMAMAATLAGCAELYSRKRPDMLLVLGDRFEMFAATAAAVPFNIPIAHMHGGELSFGAIDEVFRHSITKMSHLHFAATQDYADRIMRMGEEPWRVMVSGAPSLDVALHAELPDRETLSSRFGIPLTVAPVLATFHPVTRQYGEEAGQIDALIEALGVVTNRPIVFTAPNADGGSGTIRERIESFAGRRDDVFIVENFGSVNYLAMLREAAVVVGNSSSGLIETPAFKVPTVNIGDRQQGRTRADNVIDVAVSADAIREGIEQALSDGFRQGLVNLVNPYGDGHAAHRIVAKLSSVAIDDRLIAKRFFDSA